MCAQPLYTASNQRKQLAQPYKTLLKTPSNADGALNPNAKSWSLPSGVQDLGISRLFTRGDRNSFWALVGSSTVWGQGLVAAFSTCQHHPRPLASFSGRSGSSRVADHVSQPSWMVTYNTIDYTITYYSRI